MSALLAFAVSFFFFASALTRLLCSMSYDLAQCQRRA